MNYKGKFIVIDGIDGAGKTTQLNLLSKKLKERGYSVKTADFPQYNTKSAGLIEEYLSGKYGKADEVNSYIASIFYASDRYDASFKIKKWLQEGKMVLSNRYISSNMGHQGTKIENKTERKKYFDWLYNLEYNIFSIPKPDLTAILHVDAETSQNLTQNRNREDWHNKTKDIHEDNINHLKRAEKIYIEISNMYHDMTLIECMENNKIMSREKINDILWNKIFTELKKNKTANIHKEKDLTLYFEKISPIAKKLTTAYPGDAGFDLYSTKELSLLPGESKSIKTGIKLIIPQNHVGLIWDKSGISKNGIKTLGGVIDSNYRGEIIVTLINLSKKQYNIQKKQKIAQILIQEIKLPQIIEKKIENDTERGLGAFGSSDLF